MISKRLTNLGDTGPSFRETIVKVGDEPAMFVSSEMLQMGMGSAFGLGSPDSGPEEEPTYIGTETITVGAGTFETEVYEFVSDGDIVRGYISQSLPGMVLMEGDGTRMELMGSGSNGRSAITETPVSMEDMFAQ